MIATLLQRIFGGSLARAPRWLARFAANGGLALSVFALTTLGVAVMAGFGMRNIARTLLMLVAFVLLLRGMIAYAPATRRWAMPALNVWLAIWTLHFGIRGFLEARYGMQPNSVAVLQSVVNTTGAETREYITQALVPIAVALIGSVAAFFALRALAVAALAMPTATRLFRGLPIVGMIGAAILTAMHLSPPNRKENPIFYWADAHKALTAWNKAYAGVLASQPVMQARLPAWGVNSDRGEKRTVILVIGESVNRWNWSLYGYPRKTTPRLDAMRDQLLVFRDVISSAGNTIPELERMLTVATRDGENGWRGEPTVPMLARAAGYKVFWLSNQSDRYVNAVFARDAQVFTGINLGGHRGDTSLDEALLPHLDQALADPAEKKFIVVHMLGAHPHYEARYPAAFAKFNGADDAVKARLVKDNRFFWLRIARDIYDNAMLYQDHMLAEMIARAERHDAAGKATSLLYVSDHAQEVAHLSNNVGHAFKIESGFTVPLLVWDRSLRTLPATQRGLLEARPYQTDVLDWTLLGLLRIRTAFDKPEHDLLGPQFAPHPRRIDGKPYTPCKTCAQVME